MWTFLIRSAASRIGTQEIPATVSTYRERRLSPIIAGSADFRRQEVPSSAGRGVGCGELHTEVCAPSKCTLQRVLPANCVCPNRERQLSSAKDKRRHWRQCGGATSRIAPTGSADFSRQEMHTEVCAPSVEGATTFGGALTPVLSSKGRGEMLGAPTLVGIVAHGSVHSRWISACNLHSRCTI